MSESMMTATTFPLQGHYLNRRLRVCFNFDTSVTVLGTVVRDDAVPPYRMIIKLDDGRHVLSTECQWQPLNAGPAEQEQ